MTEAARAREAAYHFEAKKTGFGQAQDGWSITFRVQHADMPAEVKDALKGTRYQVALVEIGDDEQPINRKEAENDARRFGLTDTPPQPSPVSTASEAAGVEKCIALHMGGQRCIGKCLCPKDCSGTPLPAAGVEKRKWNELPYVQQAAIRCNEPVFRAFLREMCGARHVYDAELAAKFVRKHCDVDSRTKILPGTEAETHWLQIEEWFDAWKTRERVA